MASPEQIFDISTPTTSWEPLLPSSKVENFLQSLTNRQARLRQEAQVAQEQGHDDYALDLTHALHFAQGRAYAATLVYRGNAGPPYLHHLLDMNDHLGQQAQVAKACGDEASLEAAATLQRDSELYGDMALTGAFVLDCLRPTSGKWIEVITAERETREQPALTLV
jgi:hypothetical protein